MTESRTQARASRMGENDGGNAWHQRPQTPATWHCLGPRQPIDTRRLPDLYHSPVTPPRPLHLVLGYAPRACPWAPSRPASSRSGRDAAIKDVARISRMEPRPSSPSGKSSRTCSVRVSLVVTRLGEVRLFIFLKMVDFVRCGEWIVSWL